MPDDALEGINGSEGGGADGNGMIEYLSEGSIGSEFAGNNESMSSNIKAHG